MADESDLPPSKNFSAPSEPPEKILEPEVVGLPVREQRRKDYSNQRYVKDAEIGAMVSRLAALGLSRMAVAVASRISPTELTNWYNEEFMAGQANMQEVVARGLLEQAKAGNPQVLMYLGKSKLGWTEANVIEHTGTINAVVSAKPLTKEEFAARYLDKGDKDE